jgi:hypothetical protein
MIEFTIEAAKGNFLDRKAVQDAVGRAAAANLAKQGAAVRRLAQRSIAYAPGPSAPGEPPHGHRTGKRFRRSRSTGRVRAQSVSPLREFLYFAFDPASGSVVVGPARLNGPLGNAPEALEYGGPSDVYAGPGRTRKVRVRARPFMHPAERQARDELPSIWRDSIR